MAERKKKRIASEVQLTVSEKKYFVGFERHVRTHMAPIVRNGREIPPNPTCVRRILKDDRPSRKMLLNIFRHAPELLAHPLTHPAVKEIYGQWNLYGKIPEEYGRGTPQKCAKDCVKTEQKGKRK